MPAMVFGGETEMRHVDQCPLCERHLFLTFHHLISKKMHRRNRFQKVYTRAELARGLNSLELLRAEPQLHRHEQWLAKRRVWA